LLIVWSESRLTLFFCSRFSKKVTASVGYNYKEGEKDDLLLA